MSNYLIDDVTLTDIADAIRSKTGGSTPILTENMPSEIAGISGGGCVIDGESISEELSFGSAYIAPMVALENSTYYVMHCQKVDGRLFYLTSDNKLHYNNPNGVEYMSDVVGMCRHNGKLYIAKSNGDVGYLTYNTTTLQYDFTRVGGHTSNSLNLNMFIDENDTIYMADNSYIYDITNNIKGLVQDLTYITVPAQSEPYGIFFYDDSLYVITHYTDGGNHRVGLFLAEYINQYGTDYYKISVVEELIRSGVVAQSNVCSCDFYDNGTDTPYVVYGLAYFSGGGISNTYAFVLTLDNYDNNALDYQLDELIDNDSRKRPIMFTYDSDILLLKVGIAHHLSTLYDYITFESIVLDDSMSYYEGANVIHGIPTYYSDYQR